MYRVEVLPSARRDVIDAARYMSQTLGSPQAAGRFLDQFEERASSLRKMPYRRRVYAPLRELVHEFRAIGVGNYLLFYWVEEEPERVVTVARVLFAGSDYARSLGAE
ncbi:type II toxin-antitoxin system RelE/ParE family toxin [Olsenella sp. SW781]|uniref:type II toxin-antitoxin system RelE/ParE family toxin n=1 Tax=Olsenella sp. SW781 TaxID=2530046 RepID=UPI001439EC85